MRKYEIREKIMEGTLGEVKYFAGSQWYIPKGWLLCEGQMMSIASNTALFGILGTQYGGDGRTTFKLPTIGSLQQGIKPIICVDGVVPERS